MTLHSQRFATETLIQLSNKIPSIDIVMEYSVKPYRIDAYIPQHNIAIEIDENDHSSYDKEKEIERSRFITQHWNPQDWGTKNPTSQAFEFVREKWGDLWG